MRSVQWLFVVSAALFISGIGFIIAAERATRMAGPRPADTPPITPVANIRQIMNAIILPNATVIYESVGTTLSANGLEETAPRNDQEWAKVADSAAALVESGNLLLLGDRALDKGEWTRITRDFIAASKAALEAAEKKNVDGIFTTGGDLNVTCDACHEKYQRR